VVVQHPTSPLVSERIRSFLVGSFVSQLHASAYPEFVDLLVEAAVNEAQEEHTARDVLMLDRVKDETKALVTKYRTAAGPSCPFPLCVYLTKEHYETLTCSASQLDASSGEQLLDVLKKCIGLLRWEHDNESIALVTLDEVEDTPEDGRTFLATLPSMFFTLTIGVYSCFLFVHLCVLYCVVTLLQTLPTFCKLCCPIVS
jgi:hypothetical protein